MENTLKVIEQGYRKAIKLKFIEKAYLRPRRRWPATYWTPGSEKRAGKKSEWKGYIVAFKTEKKPGGGGKEAGEDDDDEEETKVFQHLATPVSVYFVLSLDGPSYSLARTHHWHR